MGNVYGRFQALLPQLPRMLVLEKGRTWVWRGEATGAAVVFIAVLIKGPTSICRNNNRIIIDIEIVAASCGNLLT